MAEVPIMVMPWHRPDPCKPKKNQTDAAFKASYLDYLSALSLESNPLSVPLSKIFCTIGPSSNKVDMMVDLMEHGMTGGLVPLSLGVRQDHINTIANLRTANTAFSNAKNRVFPLSIAVQTKGPGIRIGGLNKDLPIDLPLHHRIILTTDKSWRTKGTEHFLYIGFPEMCEVLGEGDVLLLGTGLVILQVTAMDKNEAVCKVVGAGVVHSYMPVSVPDVPLRLSPLTDEDVDDLKMAALLKVDIVVATRTQNANLLKDIRNVLENEENGTGIQVWAQIDSRQGLENLDHILEEADAVLLSRVSLTQDMSPNKLFLAQKIAIGSCNKAGIPVFVSSHFLPSMQMDVNPSIAELSDVAAAILDGADGFVLRNTTSIGRHPDYTVKTLTEVCREAEAAVWQHQTFSFLNNRAPPPIDPTHAIAISAVEASLKATAAAILLATTSGRSAQLVARYRPRCPIIAVSRYGQVARKLNAWRGVIPLQYIDPPLPDWSREVDVRLQLGLEYAKEHGVVVPGDCLVLLNGWRLGAGFTNTIRVVYASDSFPWVYPHPLPGSVPSDKHLLEADIGPQASRTTGRGSTQSDKPNEETLVLSSGMSLGQETGTNKPSVSQSKSSSPEPKEKHSIPTESHKSQISAVRDMEEKFNEIAMVKSREIQEHNLQEVLSSPSIMIAPPQVIDKVESPRPSVREESPTSPNETEEQK